jgi:hypothetical protein
MFLCKILCIFVVIFSFIFCSKQCRKATHYEPQLYIVSYTLQQGRTHLWCWGQRHIHNILHIRIWLPPTTVDTDFIFTISETESAAVLHHLFNVSDKTMCHHYYFIYHLKSYLMLQLCGRHFRLLFWEAWNSCPRSSLYNDRPLDFCLC